MATPRERRHDLTRQKILDRARKILAEQGLGAVSMRRLAEAVDYSPAAIYKYFENKEAILQAIREEGWRLSDQIYQKRVEGAKTPAEKILAGGRGYLEFAFTYPEHYLLMFNTPELQPGDVNSIQTDRNFGEHLQLIEEGVAQGQLRLPEGFTPLMTAMHLWISIHGAVMIRLTMMKGETNDFDALFDQIMYKAIDNMTVK